jgi:hypothetical protein
MDRGRTGEERRMSLANCLSCVHQNSHLLMKNKSGYDELKHRFAAKREPGTTCIKNLGAFPGTPTGVPGRLRSVIPGNVYNHRRWPDCHDSFRAGFAVRLLDSATTTLPPRKPKSCLSIVPMRCNETPRPLHCSNRGLLLCSSSFGHTTLGATQQN